MNVSELFIRRPVMTTLVMCAILLFGILGYRTLPINALPNVDFPTLLVTASLPGASPETMAASVATPLEKQFSTIAGIVSMSSSSSLGTALVTIQFDLTRNIDGAAQDVQAAITTAGPQLPPQMPAPPSYQKVNPADQPVLYLALSSKSLPLSQVDDYAEVYVAQRLSMVGGVAQVELFGQQKYAVRAQVDPQRLNAHNVGIDEVAQAMAAANVKQPTGNLIGPDLSWQVQTNDQLMTADQYAHMIVAYRDGAPIRLSDLALVSDSVQNDKIAAWVNQTRGVLLAIQRQPGTNTVQVIDDIKAALPNITAKIPTACKVEVLYDLASSIRDSVRDVELTLLFTVFLVVAVIFIFLRNFSATIIASLALPMSIVGTFAAMSLLGFSLNNLTLMSLTLAVGFVVDDAIVVLENIVRHMEHGAERYQAALDGSREIGFTIVSMTLSLVAVFIPVLLMGGIIGKLFKEFSLTISVAILVSGFVSLTLTPMLCSLVLRPPAEKATGLYGLFERFFASWLSLYDYTLRMVLHFRFLTIMVSFVLLGITAYLFVVTPKGFLPSEDTGELVGYTEAGQSEGFQDMVDHQQALAAIIGKDENVQSYISSVGVGGASATSNQGVLYIYLKARDQRPLSADQVVEELRPKLAAVPGINCFLQNPPTVNIGGQVTKSLYQYSLQSPNMGLLEQYTPQLVKKLTALPGLKDVTSDLEVASSQVLVQVDRDKASLLGISAQTVDQTLQDAYGTRQVSTIFTSSNEYWVILEVAPQYYTNPNFLNLLYVRSGSSAAGSSNVTVAAGGSGSSGAGGNSTPTNTPAGKLVPLSTVAKFVRGSTPLLVDHLGQLPSATVSFSLKPGMALGDALPDVDRAAREVLPPQVVGSFQGTAQAFTDSFQGLWALLVLAILVIYIVLGILYESFIHPLTILAGLPSAGLGALITLLVFHVDLNVYAFLGLIMLIGIVKKNAIMMIDFAVEEERVHGKSGERAIYDACLVRFRPIMMTTMAALMGAVPIALGIGAGAEARQPLGLCVVGGLMVSQLLTLYITPVVYIYLDILVHKFGKKPAPVTAGVPAT